MRGVLLTVFGFVGCTFGGGDVGGRGSSTGAQTDSSSGAGTTAGTTAGTSDGRNGTTAGSGDGGSSMGLDSPETTIASADTGGPMTGSSGTGGDATSSTGLPTDGTSTSDPGSTSTGEVADCEPDPWFDPDWSARRRLDIDNAGLSEDLTGFPVLLRLDPSRIDYSMMQPGGEDLRVVAADHATVLPHEVEAWNDGGDSLVWVRVENLPSDASLPAPLYIYYGNDAATAADDPAAVWDADFVSVHHMATLDDSTGLGHDGFSVNAPTTVGGIIGPVAQFDGIDDYVELPLESDFDFSNQLTVSALVSVDSFTVPWQAIVTKGDDAWRLHRAAETAVAGFGTDGLAGNANQSGSTEIAGGEWFHITIIMDGITKRIFVDASLDAQNLGAFVNQSDDPVMFGENAQETGRFFHGRLDEVRISSDNRSDTWIDAEARTMLTDDMVAYAAEEPCTP